MIGRPLPNSFRYAIPPLLTILCGGVVYCGLIYPLRRAANAATWPRVPCIILESTVRGVDGSRTLFEPRVRYRYTVASQDYEGDRIWFGLCVSQQGKHPSESAILPYPAGGTTTCRVNPGDPADSVLEPVLRGSISWVLGAAFGLGCLISLAATVLAYRRPASKPAAA